MWCFHCLCSLLHHELSPPRMIRSFQFLPFWTFLISTLSPWSSTGNSFLIVSYPAMSFYFLWPEFCRAFWHASLIWLFQSSTNLEFERSSITSSVGDSIKSIGKRGFCPKKESMVHILYLSFLCTIVGIYVFADVVLPGPFLSTF